MAHGRAVVPWKDRGMPSSEPEPAEPLVRQVDVPIRALSHLQPFIGRRRFRDLRREAAQASDLLDGTTVWNVSSTAAGGGVAEMLQVLVGYTLDAGVDIRWLVMSGDPDFFSTTKRIHNRLHGVEGDPGALGPVEQDHYAAVTEANAEEVAGRLSSGDVVILHDPQTAGMAARLARAGARVVWRCHVGRESTNQWTEQAWSFLQPHLAFCEAFVFSVRSYVPAWMDDTRVRVIPPSIDPLSPKNADMSPNDVARVLRQIGLSEGRAPDAPTAFIRRDGTLGHVERKATIVSDGSKPIRPEIPLVVQVSRWDRLKDMGGVLRGFATEVVGAVDAHLALVGPSVESVTDDPEGAEVLAECTAEWEALPADTRRRVSLVTLPMEDIDENAAMVNAIQGSATVIVQKSLMEGFGLTVAEGMWKAKAVLASRVGGIAEQVVPGTGVLLDDPSDLAGFGKALAGLLSRPHHVASLGAKARRHVLDSFIGDKHLILYAHLMGDLSR